MKKGFTLMELLAVIAIIAILAMLAVTSIIKIYNNSKKKAFEIEVRKAVKLVDGDLDLDSDMVDIIDCSKIVEGDSFLSCEARFEGGKPYLNVVGANGYSNYIMLDVTIESDSGVLIDLGELNELSDDGTVQTKDLIDKNTGALNNNFYTKQTPQDILNTINSLSFIDSELKQELETVGQVFIDGIEGVKLFLSADIADGQLLGGNGNILAFFMGADGSEDIPEEGLGIPVYIAKFSIDSNKGGNYNIKTTGSAGDYLYLIISENGVKKILKRMSEEYENSGFSLSENDIQDMIISSNDVENAKVPFLFGNYKVDNGYDYDQVDGSDINVSLSENDTYYVVFILQDMYGDQDSTSILNQFTLTKYSELFNIKGESSVVLLKDQVNSYVDAGVKSDFDINSKTYYVEYTDLKNAVGNYRYNYYIKQNNEIKRYSRRIYVVSETYEDYIQDSQYYKGIELVKNSKYYDFYCGASGGKMDVGEVCERQCSNINYLKVNSKESDYTKIILLMGGSCPQ